MDIPSLLKRISRGKHGSEHLHFDEAEALFSELLKPEADPLQLGAFLIAQRMKGESAEELAGFVQASRAHISHFGDVVAPAGAVDLPCYAGKRRAAPIHLLAALKVRDAGTPVVVHGVKSIEGRVSAWDVLEQSGVKQATTLLEAEQMLAHEGVVYLDLEQLCPDLNRVYNLRDRLGVRTFANTVARLLNPMQCEGQLNGFFHAPYADHMAKANVLLGQKRSLIFMGAEGEPELYADRQKLMNRQQGTAISPLSMPDSGCDYYPKEPAENLEQLMKDFTRMQAGDLTDREAATLQRMVSAFNWASSAEALN